MFKKLFGKKNDGFYLQLEDSDAKSTPVAEKPVAKAAPAAEPAATATVEAPAPAAESEAAPAAKTDKKAAAKSEKKSVNKAEAPAAPAPVAPVAPAAPATTFAPDYLIKPSSRSSRRTPGANMSGFLSMARQVQKPANIK